MTRWTVAPDGRHLLRDGRDDFLLLDTLWAALQRTPLEDLRTVAARRRSQGFSGALLTVLPVANDRSGDVPAVFAEENGVVDHGRLDAAYLDQAKAKLAVLTEHGLTPVLMLSWVCWLPATWAEGPADLTQEQLLATTRQAVEAFAEFDPIWSVSGDDTMTNPDAVGTYVAIARLVRELAPDALVTTHTGAFANVPQPLLEAVDFVSYQSGHDGGSWRGMPQAYNRYLARRTPRKPFLNAEPVYEGHGYGMGAGRHDLTNVRIASWTSVVTGAGAGLGYGAHGLWSWHRTGDSFTSVDWSSMPFDALDALEFPAADELAWLRETAIRERLWELDDRTDLLQGDRSGAVAGADVSLDRVVVFAPTPGELRLLGCGHRVRGYSLDTRTEVEVACEAEGGGRMLHIGVPRELGPHLYIIER